MSGGTAAQEALPKGAAIGRYVVLGLVGRGGMGEVYAAYDPELDRRIAVKLLRGLSTRGNDEEGKIRLLREAQAIAKLSHPNVIVVHDVGTFRDSVFIAMEFVEGNTIGYWLQAAPRSWRDVLKVFAAAGAGLAAAHDAGMVHRDFKPDNVMLTKDGQVRVMDFGLARQFGEGEAESAKLGPEQLQQLVEQAAEADLDETAKLGPDGAPSGQATSSGSYLRQKLTQTGALVGTPAYMAPEQFAGKVSDARTDQFAFCIALYEALYGHRPFEGDTVITLMANVVSGNVRAAPDDTEVPARLRKVLLQGLDPDPEKRFFSMAQLLAALSDDPSVKRRGWVTAAAALSLALATVVVVHRLTSREKVSVCGGGPERLAGIWDLGGDSPRKQRLAKAFAATGNKRADQVFAGVRGLLDTYVGAWASAYRETCEATHVRGEQSAEVLDLRMSCLGERLTTMRVLVDVLASGDSKVVDNAVNAVGSLPTLDRCNDVAMLKAVIRPPDDAATRTLVADIREQVAKARALFESGQCTAAVDAGHNAVTAAKATEYRPLLAESLWELGRFGNNCLDNRAAIDALEEASWTAMSSNHDEVAIESSSLVAGYYADRLHDTATGRRWVRHAEAILARLPDHPMLEAFVANGRGQVFLSEGDTASNLKEQQRQLELKEQALGPNHPETAAAAMNLGVAFHELGRDAEAEPPGRRSVETFDRVLGPDSVQSALALLDYGETLTALARPADARAALTRAIRIWKGAGASAFFIAYAEFDLARVALAEDKPAEARALLEGAVEVLGKQDPTVGAQARLLLAEALWRTPRERGKAVTLARRAREELVAAAAPAKKTAEVDDWLKQHTTL